MVLLMCDAMCASKVMNHVVSEWCVCVGYNVCFNVM